MALILIRIWNRSVLWIARQLLTPAEYQQELQALLAADPRLKDWL